MISRQVLLLSTLFGLSTISGTVVIAAASVVGLELSSRQDLATLPVALALLGGMAATLPAAQVMARWGRRAGFLAGTTVAMAGAVAAAVAIHSGQFWLFCVGSFLIGSLGGVSSYYRFTAVEVTPPAQQPRAIGLVLAGGLGAGLLGPPLGAAARNLWGPAFAGSYLIMAALAVLIVLLLPFLKAPPPVPRAARTGRPISEILRDRRFVAAVVAAITAFATMVLTMVAAPLSLHTLGHGFEATAFVIQAHVVAMFAPSFFSGSLVARFGPPRMMAAGLAFITFCATVNLLGATTAHHWVALVLLGIGWNFLFVAATTLLTRTHTPGEKARVQGFNDFLVATTGAAAALAAGPLLAAVGWGGVNVAVFALLACSASALSLLLGRQTHRAPPAPVPQP